MAGYLQRAHWYLHSNGNDGDSLSFEAIAATCNDVITGQVFSDNVGNDLAFGSVAFWSTVPPEPGSLLALDRIGIAQKIYASTIEEARF